MSPGLRYMAAAALAFSAMSVLVKLASATLPAAEIVLARAIVTLVLSVILVARAGLSPWGTRRASLVLRGGFGFAALACYYWSLGQMPLAEATMIHQTSPIWIAVLAWALLGETVGAGTVVALVLGLAGVALVARPTGTGLAPGAVAIALAGALASAAALVTVRRLATTEHPLVIVLYFPMVALPAALVWAAPVLVVPSLRELALLVGVGVCTQVAQVCMTYGLSTERAARAMAVGYLQVVFAVGWGLAAFGEVPALTTVLGAIAIVGGTAVVSMRAARRDRPATAASPP